MIFLQKYLLYSATVNMVIFAGGKFRENDGATFRVGVIFAMSRSFPFLPPPLFFADPLFLPKHMRSALIR